MTRNPNPSRLITLPFPGFYGSDYADALDRDESDWAEHHATESDGDESTFPEPLRLDASDVGDSVYMATDYRPGFVSVARQYVGAFDYHLGEALNLNRAARRWRFTDDGMKRESYRRPSAGLKFESLDSPREYNFSTDRIFAYIPRATIRAAFARSKADDHKTLAAVIVARHSSRSGFASFYESDLADWLATPLAEWDHNHLQTLIIAVLALEGQATTDGDLTSGFRDELYESVFSGNGEESAWQEGTDWRRYETERAKRRAPKLAAWRRADPDAANAWISANPDAVAAMGDEFVFGDAK
mgnify:CR=1 FL=1